LEVLASEYGFFVSLRLHSGFVESKLPQSLPFFGERNQDYRSDYKRVVRIVARLQHLMGTFLSTDCASVFSGLKTAGRH